MVGFHIFLLSAVFPSHYSNNLSLRKTPKSLPGLVTWRTYKIISHLKYHCITLNYITIVILMLSVYHNLIYHNYEIQVIIKQSSTHLKKQLTKYNLLLKKITRLNFTASEKDYILMIILMIIQWLKCSWASFNCKLNRLTHYYEYSKTTINNNTNSKLSQCKTARKGSTAMLFNTNKINTSQYLESLVTSQFQQHVFLQWPVFLLEILLLSNPPVLLRTACTFLPPSPCAAVFGLPWFGGQELSQATSVSWLLV